MGAYICIFPDKLYYNTADPTDHGHMDAEWSYTGKIRYSMCSILGEEYPAAEESGTEPSDPADGDCWIDTSEHVLRRWNAASEMWTDIESVYLKLSFDTQGQIPSKFSIYDGAELSGSAAAAANGSKIIYALGGSAGTAPGFEDAESDWIVVAAEPVNGFTQQNGSISLVRGVPDMDYVCQCGNRLWGCRYGNDGKRISTSCIAALWEISKTGASTWASRPTRGARPSVRTACGQGRSTTWEHRFSSRKTASTVCPYRQRARIR